MKPSIGHIILTVLFIKAVIKLLIYLRELVLQKREELEVEGEEE